MLYFRLNMLRLAVEAPSTSEKKKAERIRERLSRRDPVISVGMGAIQ
jgi:hypothetical protein